jgi:hypothetical protein
MKRTYMRSGMIAIAFVLIVLTTSSLFPSLALAADPSGVGDVHAGRICDVLKNRRFLACENQRFSRHEIKDFIASHDEVVRTANKVGQHTEGFLLLGGYYDVGKYLQFFIQMNR